MRQGLLAKIGRLEREARAEERPPILIMVKGEDGIYRAADGRTKPERGEAVVRIEADDLKL